MVVSTGQDSPQVTCLECGTVLGGGSGKDAYKHLLHCLHVEPDALERIREAAVQVGNEHGKRVIHIVDALLAPRHESHQIGS